MANSVRIETTGTVKYWVGYSAWRDWSWEVVLAETRISRLGMVHRSRGFQGQSDPPRNRKISVRPGCGFTYNRSLTRR